MMRKRPGTQGAAAAASLQFANRIAQRGDATPIRVQFAKAMTGVERLEHASSLLQGAVAELEMVAASTIDGDERADLYEAIGSIMDSLQMIAAAHADAGALPAE